MRNKRNAKDSANGFCKKRDFCVKIAESSAIFSQNLSQFFAESSEFLHNFSQNLAEFS
ncbi:hypothetical protein ACWIUD_10750 [Helicobacter sp. 23-1044]